MKNLDNTNIKSRECSEAPGTIDGYLRGNPIINSKVPHGIGGAQNADEQEEAHVGKQPISVKNSTAND